MRQTTIFQIIRTQHPKYAQLEATMPAPLPQQTHTLPSSSARCSWPIEVELHDVFGCGAHAHWEQFGKRLSNRNQQLLGKPVFRRGRSVYFFASGCCCGSLCLFVCLLSSLFVCVFAWLLVFSQEWLFIHYLCIDTLFQTCMSLCLYVARSFFCLSFPSCL